LTHLREVTKTSGRVSLDDALELLHFGFREIVRDPDRLLARRGMGRVHHRLLYFCRRNPDPSITEVLAILDVSKQALHRPLGDLVRAGLIVVAPDAADRRTRRLALTKKGRAFEEQLSQLQRAEFARAFDEVGDDGARAWARVMSLLGHGKTAVALRAAANRRRRSG
jgi:DNA-binding MarR family transcriptional regulator